MANAEANHGLIGAALVVAAAYVDEGPTIKRWRARARGRATRIKKHTCHVTIRLVPGETDTQTRPRRQQPEPAAEEQPKAEEKPKRAPRKRATPKAEGAAEKPKPKRTPRKKKEETEAT